jgi:UDP-glucose:(heptosyl)LPS alpha-1,3-glucosyltransferase
MRVAIVQEQIDVRRGGAETSTLEMARHLAVLGLDVTVVCAEAGRHEGTEVRRHEGVTIHSVDVVGGSRVGRTIQFVGEADRFCREEGFGIIHAVTPCFSCNVYQPRGGTYVETVRQSIARAGSPLARLVKRIGRRFNRRQRFLLLVEREILTDREPPFVAAVSNYVARQVGAAFPRYPADRLRVVFNGVEIDPLSPDKAQTHRADVRRELGLDEATPLVLFVAHNFKLKGLGELIRAAAPSAARLGRRRSQSPTLERVGHPGVLGSNWVLAVVGRDSPSRYRRLARRRGVADRVRFLGSRDDIRPVYAAADVLAHPTWHDPCSRVVLEALSCGLPVVTTRFNGAAEVIEDGRHGVVIDSPRDTAALATAIETCLQPIVRQSCAEDAPRLRATLSMDRHSRELKAMFEVVSSDKC